MAKRNQQAEATEPEETVEAAPKGSIEVNLDGPEDEDDDADPEPEPQPSRRAAKKRERYSDMAARAQQAEERAARAEQLAQEASQRAMWAAQQAQHRGEAPPDPDEQEIKAARAEQELLVREFEQARAQGALDAAKQAEFREKGYKLRERENAAIYRREARKMAPNAEQRAAYEARQQFQVRYPDVAANPRAQHWVLLEAQKRVLEGHPNDWSTLDKVVEEARSMNGGGQRRQDPTLSRKLEGQPRGASGAAPSKGPVRLSAQDVEMADAAFGHLPKEQRYTHFAKQILAKRQAKGQ